MIKKGLYSKCFVSDTKRIALYFDIQEDRLNKMGDFIRYFIEEMIKEAIELTCAVMVNILKYVPGVKGVDEAVSIGSRYLLFLPDQLKVKGMCNKALCREPSTLKFVPVNIQTQEMWKRDVEKNPRLLKYVPGGFKTKETVISQ